MGVIGITLLVLFGGGSNDLVSWIDADDFFRERRTEITPARMVELAGREPAAGGAAPVARLLAIRWLGEHPDGLGMPAQGLDGFASHGSEPRGQFGSRLIAVFFREARVAPNVGDQEGANVNIRLALLVLRHDGRLGDPISARFVSRGARWLSPRLTVL